ncbi:hypothetical protein YC2023_040966 [Brassica napus]
MDGKDVGIAKPPYTTMDIGITITVVVDPVLAMVKGEEAVAFLSHHTLPKHAGLKDLMIYIHPQKPIENNGQRKQRVVETIPAFSTDLDYAKISMIRGKSHGNQIGIPHENYTLYGMTGLAILLDNNLAVQAITYKVQTLKSISLGTSRVLHVYKVNMHQAI